MADLTDEHKADMRAYIAKRVPQLRGKKAAGSHKGPEAAAWIKQAKGEWMLKVYEAEGNRVGAALLTEMIGDFYGVPR